MLNKVEVRQIKITDYSAVKRVDELTQLQYLGKKWQQINKKDKEKHLVSRKSEFKYNVKTGYSFVAVRNSKVVGFSFAYETLPFTGTIFIRYIAVNPKFQGKGIGILLLNALISKAKSTDIKSIKSMINNDNPSSKKLHKKVGFSLKDRSEATIHLR